MFPSVLVIYYFIFKKSEKLIEIWDLGMSISNVVIKADQVFLNKVYVAMVCAGNEFRIALSRRCQHA